MLKHTLIDSHTDTQCPEAVEGNEWAERRKTGPEPSSSSFTFNVEGFIAAAAVGWMGDKEINKCETQTVELRYSGNTI